MRLSRLEIILALTLAGGGGALAQSSNAVSGATDYAAFSRFITDRNIFDPNRQPHSSTGRRTTTRTRTRTAATPAFSFVGTMDYAKGRFAFFSGNSAELKKALPVSESIAGYTVTEILQTQVRLASADQKEQLELKVGDVMRQENGKWQLSGTREINDDSSAAAGRSTAPTEAATTSGPAAEPNDVLKRLMEKREQENQ